MEEACVAATAGQGHQDGFEVDEGQVHDHTDDGHTCCSCSLGVNANLCVHIHELHPDKIASKVSSDSIDRRAIHQAVT